MNRLPVRLRLTVAFTMVMAVVLAATGAFLYFRLQHELDESLEQSLRSRAGEILATTDLQPGRGPEQESFAQVIGPDDRVRDGTTTVPALSAAQLDRARRAALFVDRGAFDSIDDPQRMLARPVGGGSVVVVGDSRDERDEALGSLRILLFTGGPIALLLTALVGYGLTSAAMRPIDELVARLRRSVQRERGFVASASHELRTPLALLKGELELALRAGRSPEELRAAIESAAEESDRLAQLAEDLLILARFDEGKLPVRREPLELGELLGTVAKRFESRADGRLRVEARPDLTLDADRLRLEQALSNLVDNALRHGAGEVSLTGTRSDGFVDLAVTDQGDGIPDELGDSAFERFTRGDPARSRGGAGLGLAIVEAVALAHGGSVAAAKAPGGGAEVRIRLPVRKGSGAPARTPA